MGTWYIGLEGRGLNHEDAKRRDFIVLAVTGSILYSVAGVSLIKLAMWVLS